MDPSRLFDLTDRVAIVTGAAGQLGGQYCAALLAAGAAVAAFDRDLARPGSRLAQLAGDRLLPLAVDVTEKKSIADGLARTLAHFGPPQVLINNAAIDAPPDGAATDTGPFEDYPESAWDALADVNLKGVFLCCQGVGAEMARRGGGSIINVSSIYATLAPDHRIYAYRDPPFFKPAGYGVTKAGVEQLTRYLAAYWAGRGVRVNTLVLGGVAHGQDERFVRAYAERVPLGRMARPDEYNGAVLFLASEASSYMTGASVVLDGGYRCW